MINGLSRNDYYKEYQRLRKANIYCSYCNYYCTKFDKHYKTDTHLHNLSIHLKIDSNLLKKK